MNIYSIIPFLPKKVPGKEYIKAILMPSTQEFGLMFGDRVRLLRFKSSLRVYQGAMTMLKEAGLSAKPVDLKMLVPLLEHCSLEKDDSPLIEKWAGLLATVSSQGALTYSYPHILNELSPKEVKLLDKIWEGVEEEKITREKWATHGFEKSFITDSMSISDDEFYIIADNLFRLNLLQPAGSSGILAGDQPIAIKTYKIICLTPLGYDFVKACRGPIDQAGERNVMPIVEAPHQDNVARFG